MSAICCVNGCIRQVKAKGLCQAHYVRMRRGADLGAPLMRTGTDAERLKAKTKVNPKTGCWEWTASLNTNGYGQFSYNGTSEQAHRVSWILFRGEIPKNESAYGTTNVLRKCDNPLCVNPEHLFLGDQTTNCLDAVNKGRWGKRGMIGEAHGRTSLTEDDVREIRASCEPSRAIAKKFGISAGAVQHIRKRRSWRHVT